jgi:hypothetical protein
VTSRFNQTFIGILAPVLALTLLLPPSRAQDGSSGTRPPSTEGRATFAKVVANQQRMEHDLDLYERRQKIELHKNDTNTIETKIWRVFPSGPGQTKIALAPDGNPMNLQTYRTDLEKLVKYLSWIIQPGSAEREAYSKSEHKRKERNELLVSTQEAFVFTRLSTEMRRDRTLVKYSMRPNPNFKPTTRNGFIFTRVEGNVWVDEQSGEMARIEGVVTEDISIAMFLAKVYKGSHFMQERYEYFPGVWFPSYEQYDFDGRKYLLPFSIHERTFYSDYKRVGPPEEAIRVVRAELDKLAAN